MREIVLRRFFEGSLTETDLAQDLKGSLVSAGLDLTRHPIEDMDGEFAVLPSHLIKLCDSVLNGSIPAEFLESVGFCLVASDAFSWDSDTTEGRLVADVVIDWSDPLINHPLNFANVANWRRALLGKKVTWATP